MLKSLVSIPDEYYMKVGQVVVGYTVASLVFHTVKYVRNHVKVTVVR